MSMNLPLRGTAMRVLVALLAVAAAVLLRLALLDMLGPRTPFVTFYPAAMIAALFGGLVSGLLAAALLSLAAYFWVLPQLAPYVLSDASWLALAMFLLSCVLVSGLAEALHRARIRATEAEVQAALAAQRCKVDADLQHLAAIVESSDDAILSATMDGRITSWNQGAQRLYGYTAAEALGQPALMLCPPGRADEVQEVLARLAAGESVRNFETVRQRKDGSLVDVSVTLSAIRDSGCSLAGASIVVRDIAERKQAEAALRETQQRLLFSQELALIGQWDLNLATNTLHWGPGVFKIFEIEPGTLSPSYEAFLALVHPADREALDKAYRESLASGEEYSMVHRMVMPDGRIKWIREACRHERDAGGKPLRSLGIVQDITELKRTEAALRESEAFSRTIIDNSPDCIKLLAQNGELTYMSPSGPRLLEMDSVEPLLGMPYLSFWQGSDHELAANAFLEAQAGRVGRFEGFCPTASGTPKWWDVSIAPLGGGGKDPNRFLVVSRDDTARKLAADALRESEELFRSLVESAPKPIFVQADGRFAYANSACLELYGATRPEDLLDKPVLARIHPDCHELAASRMHKVNAERQAQPPVEQRHLRLDGPPVDVEISAVPLLYGGKNGALVFVHDITERKREEALRGDMERIAKHDLKGPLNAVINLPLLYQDDANLTANQAEGLRLIHQAGLRMLEQIDQSLTLYRIETGSFELTPQAVDLGGLSRQVAKELDGLTRALGVGLQLSGEADIPPISGDGLLCRTMLSNLLKNAVEASPRGGLVEVRLGAAGDQAEWSVHNAGTVPETLRESFFDKYSTHGKRHGVGLGTYSARLSAEAQGGTVAMHSSESLGTTVTVRLPLWPGDA